MKRSGLGAPSFALALVVTAVAAAGACGEDATTFGDSGAGAGTGTGTVASGTGGLFGTGGAASCDADCPSGEVCSHDVCVPAAPCEKNDDCQYDTYCGAEGTCLPWSEHVPAYDPACVQVIASGLLSPKTQCAFSEAPMGDPFPGHVDVQGTPIVVNVNKTANVPDVVGPGPSLIAASFTATVPTNYTEELGVIRVLDGKTCALVQNLGGVDVDGDMKLDYTVSSAALAAADLTGDGYADIVAYGSDGSTLAFAYDPGTETFKFAWKAPRPAGAPWNPCDFGNHRCDLGWGGPSIHDLDDDGVPEIVREGIVFSALGAPLTALPPGYVSYGQGLFPVLANLDGDPDVEITNGQFVWAYAMGAWVKDDTFATSGPGLVAIGDFGAYGAGLPANRPEIAIVRSGFVQIHAMTGEVVQAPIAVPGGGSGGPPTVGDFDGDGLAELGVAAKGAYTVYDLDCGPAPRPNGVCQKGSCDGSGGVCPQGVAWSRTTQDLSSSVTGSSIFDFEADGASEVVYADECFTRVYEGKTGKVLFSQYTSSCTWHENPIIADVDGDFRAELVAPANKACSPNGAGIACTFLTASGVDPLYDGVRCDDAKSCVSGVCDGGLCRCTATGQCCAQKDDAGCTAEGFLCVPPEATGEPQKGNTCRAGHPAGVSGIRVFSDANDAWVPSRRIWTQHAYAITHIDESGTVPKTSAWKNNWEVPELNNFRQNSPGVANATGIGDATAGASKDFICKGTSAELFVDVCNRGALPIPAGLSVGFYVEGKKVCGTVTVGTLFPSDCVPVSCTWEDAPAPPSSAADVTVIADDASVGLECNEGNNTGGVFGVLCENAS